MVRFSHIVVMVVIGAIVGGAVFLANWDMPPPSSMVEKVIPNDRFPR